MPTFRERAGGWLNAIESRWTLWTLIQGSGLVASFAIPAWATQTAQIFVQYEPLSWVVAGFLGVLAWVSARLIWHWAGRLKIRNQWDARMLDHGSIVNPLDLTFERKRIILNDFVLPSWTFIEGKTFIDCDLIGPANVYFHTSNQASPIRPPKVDAVWLDPKATFNNGFVFNNCIFRNCSFQRITIYASIENYENWKDNPNVNWISIPPTPELIAVRKTQIGIAETPKIEAQHSGENTRVIEQSAAPRLD